MNIREATIEDANAISGLIKSLTNYFTLHPEGKGAEDFLKSIQPPAIASYIQSTNFLYLVGLVEIKITGVIAIRNQTHLYHLFVATEFQGQRIGRKLWEYAKEKATLNTNINRFTVNSTPNAVPVYERFGFQVTGEKIEMKGIAFIPMETITGIISTKSSVNGFRRN